MSESTVEPHQIQTGSEEIDRLWEEFLHDSQFQQLLQTVETAGRGKRLKPFLSLLDRARQLQPQAFESKDTKRQLNSSFVRRFREIAGL